MRTRSLTLALALLAACSGGKPAKSAAARDSLTERQRDSILAQSRIPGASGVGSAMRAADSASARVRRIRRDRKSTRLNSSHGYISYAVFCLKKKKHKR